jgi:hypothetical protein
VFQSIAFDLSHIPLEYFSKIPNSLGEINFFKIFNNGLSMENLIISKNHLTPAFDEFNLDIWSIN